MALVALAAGFVKKAQKVRILFTGAPEPLEGVTLAGGLEFDASVEEVHAITVDVTKHPLERGAVVSDHKIKKPAKLRITTVTTNTPILHLAAFRLAGIPGGATPDVHAWDTLERLAEGEELLTVTTSLKTYDNMVIRKSSVPRDAARGNTLEATIDLEEIFTVGLASVQAPEVSSGVPGASQLDQGKGAAAPAGVEQKRTFLGGMAGTKGAQLAADAARVVGIAR